MLEELLNVSPLETELVYNFFLGENKEEIEYIIEPVDEVDLRN